jgi:hypothetical protein
VVATLDSVTLFQQVEQALERLLGSFAVTFDGSALSEQKVAWA